VSIGTGTGAAQQLTPKKKPRRHRRTPPGNGWKLAIIGLIGVYIVLAGYDLIANSGQLGLRAVAAASSAPRPAERAAGTVGGTPQPVTASSGPTAAPTARAASQPASRPLDVISVTAFGPNGASDGDNPGITGRILDASTDQPWYSQWYATPEYAGLRSGTGLMLDLGTTETVTEVGLTLGSTPGADLQVRVGSTPSVDLPSVASASGAGGTIRLTTNSARGRYVLIWFTRLPSVGHGHYQVNVYSVAVDGVSG
jgi:hypothetical protein